MLKTLLAHPLTRGLDLDDPATTHLRGRIIREKGFLRRLYAEWYRDIASTVPTIPGATLELGSGGGFMREHVPDLITSEVFCSPGVRVVLSGLRLPFADGTLRAIVMTNVFHHLADPQAFLTDAARCVRSGGIVSMIEPWVTGWSRFVYGYLHHEPFRPERGWHVPQAGPLSGANSALPWIVLDRDRERFERELPAWRIERVTPMMPFAYLLSGGVSLRALAPDWSYSAARGVERLLDPWSRHLAMFAHIVLRRT